jgi:hypothetical protein
MVGHFENDVGVDLVTEEKYDEESFGRYLPFGCTDLEAWRVAQKRRLVENGDNGDASEWEDLLLTAESFPSTLEDDDSFVQEPQAATLTKTLDNGSPTKNKLPSTLTVDGHKSFRRWKTKRKSRKPRGEPRQGDDHDSVGMEVAEVIQQGIQWEILTQTPTLYSLLRAWVLRNTNNQSSACCRRKRKSLVDYASLPSKIAGSGDHNDLLNSPPTTSTCVNNFPVVVEDLSSSIDILHWLKIRHILKESSPYPPSALKQGYKARTYKRRLAVASRRKSVNRARRCLFTKGIIV